MDIALTPVTEIARALRDGDLSSRELLDHLIGRIERIDPILNAVVTLDVDAAAVAAAAADERRAAGARLPPLHGVPITVKDALATRGLRSTGGAAELSDHVPDTDAPTVAAVREAGAIVMGKTNLPRWSADIQSYNELFGTTNNPWDPSVVPGGSSGGAAAAVAAGLTGFEIGTDIGGSIRFPASFCGVWGHKPTWGIVPSTGYLDHAMGGTTEADVNVIGPLARSADDLELLLGLMLRPEPFRPQLRPAPNDVRSLRVAAWLDDEFCPVDRQVLDVLESMVAALEESGVRVDRAARPDIDPTEASDLGQVLVAQAMLESGSRDGVAHREWLVMHRRREVMRARWAEFFTTVDALLAPVAFVPPFPHQQDGTFATRTLVCNGEVRAYADIVRWTILTGMAYLPATVPPVGRTPAGLPIGVQVVGPAAGDLVTIALARHIGEITGGYEPPPVAVDGV